MRLTHPIVKAFIEWIALPYDLKPEGIETQQKFLVAHGYSAKSYKTLNDMYSISGFEEARKRAEKKVSSHYISAAKTGLLKRAKGVIVKTEIERNTPQGAGSETIRQELAPDVSACKTILKIFDDYKETFAIEGGLAAKIKSAAERMDSNEAQTDNDTDTPGGDE